MFNGIEVDMLSLGDADSILITEWNGYGVHRVLIDGGNESDAEVVREFLRSRNVTYLYAVVCSHLHNDHAQGLIKLVRDKSVRIATGWKHDIRNHVSAEALRHAPEDVQQVIENTKALSKAFESRGLIPQEPFAGAVISAWPSLTVFGPSQDFYRDALKEFTKVSIAPAPIPFPLLTKALLGAEPPIPSNPTVAALLSQPAPRFSPLPFSLAPFGGVLSDSSVKENPTTQPFNNTSVILGTVYNGQKLLFTADAGAEALDRIPPEWNQLYWMQVPHHGSDGNLSQNNIERFCPKFACISACGDDTHPDRAIVNGLIKVGAQVFSTHSLNPGHLWFWIGNVPARAGYGPAVPLKGTSIPVHLPGLYGILPKLG